MHTMENAGDVISDMEFTGFTDSPPGQDGRIIHVNSAPNGLVHNVGFNIGDDDAVSVVGDNDGFVVANCEFVVGADWTVNTKAMLLTLDGGVATDRRIGADRGYAGTFYNCDFEGVIRSTGGVWNFINCEFTCHALYAIDAYNASINFINCNFRTIAQPGGTPYWYQNGVACPVRVSDHVGFSTGLTTRVYFQDCTLNGVAKYGRELCRFYDATLPPGTHYSEPLTVPLRCIKTSPITESID